MVHSWNERPPPGQNSLPPVAQASQHESPEFSQHPILKPPRSLVCKPKAPSELEQNGQAEAMQQVLRTQFAMPVRNMFTCVVLEDGHIQMYSTPSLPDSVVSKFFYKERFAEFSRQAEPGTLSREFILKQATERTPPSRPSLALGFDGTELGPGEGAFSRPREEDEFEAMQMQPKARKRQRSNVATTSSMSTSRDSPDAEPSPSTSAGKKPIRIDESDALTAFYTTRFCNLQQTACKIIAKAWIKAVEPKKQSTHPYTGKDEKAPEWWPKPWGPSKDERIRHKEPDHLYKKERVKLLIHILRLAVMPNHAQPEDVRKSSLSVSKLEEVTNEAMSAFFSDKDNPGNSRKRVFINEILKISKQEERYQRGEIDGATEVYISTEDKGNERLVEEILESDAAAPQPSLNTQVPPAMSSSSAHPLMPSAPGTAVQSPTGPINSAPNMANGQYMGQLPTREPILHPEMNPGHHYVDGNSSSLPPHSSNVPMAHSNNVPMSMSSDMVTSPHSHDGSRRPSMMFTSNEYNSGSTTTTPIYPSQGQWAPSPSNSNIYAFTSPPTHGSSSNASPHSTSSTGGFQPIGPGQNTFMGLSGYDNGNIPRTHYEPNNMFRTGGPQSAGGFQSYVPDPRGPGGIGRKPEPGNLH